MFYRQHSFQKDFSRVSCPKKMGGSDLLYPVEDHVPEEILKLYGRTEETMMDDVMTLKDWMKTQTHLPEILDDRRIRNFLLLNKCSIEKTKQKIDMYYTIRSLIPDMYENINPKHENMILTNEIIYWVPLPKLTKEMYRVAIFKLRKKELIDKLEPRELVALIFNVQDIRLKEDHMLGDIIVVDMEGITWNHMAKFTPTMIVKIVAIYEKVYSLRLKAMYMINSHPSIGKILAIMKNIIKPKIFERVHVYKNANILDNILSKEMLPSDYGGLEKSCEEFRELVNKKFCEYQDRFDQLDKLRVNENLRPQKLENDEILGFYGNFKQLVVD